VNFVVTRIFISRYSALIVKLDRLFLPTYSV